MARVAMGCMSAVGIQRERPGEVYPPTLRTMFIPDLFSKRRHMLFAARCSLEGNVGVLVFAMK